MHKEEQLLVTSETGGDSCRSGTIAFFKPQGTLFLKSISLHHFSTDTLAQCIHFTFFRPNLPPFNCQYYIINGRLVRDPGIQIPI